MDTTAVRYNNRTIMTLTVQIPTEREDVLRPLAPILDLFSLPPDWNGDGYAAPDSLSIIHALYWTINLQREIAARSEKWTAPHATASADGEAVLEWWHREKKLTVYFTAAGQAEYVASWGLDLARDMREGRANSPEDRAALWEWLYG